MRTLDPGEESSRNYVLLARLACLFLLNCVFIWLSDLKVASELLDAAVMLFLLAAFITRKDTDRDTLNGLSLLSNTGYYILLLGCSVRAGTQRTTDVIRVLFLVIPHAGPGIFKLCVFLGWRLVYGAA